MKFKTITLNLTEEAEKFLIQMCEYTGLSVSGLVTGILWDMILREEDKKKKKKK